MTLKEIGNRQGFRKQGLLRVDEGKYTPRAEKFVIFNELLIVQLIIQLIIQLIYNIIMFSRYIPLLPCRYTFHSAHLHHMMWRRNHDRSLKGDSDIPTVC